MATHTYRAKDSASALDLIERRLGKDAYILSLEADGNEVVVLASDAPLRPAPAKPKPAEPAAPQPQSKPGEFRPRFLDPKTPKPFAPGVQPAQTERPAELERPAPTGKPEPLVFASRLNASPVAHQNSGVSVPVHAHDPRPRPVCIVGSEAAACRHIVLFTRTASELFALCLEVSRLWPQRRLVSWQSGEDWPLSAVPAADQTDSVVMVVAAGDALTGMLSAAANAPAVAAVRVVPPGLPKEHTERLLKRVQAEAGANTPASKVSTPQTTPIRFRRHADVGRGPEGADVTDGSTTQSETAGRRPFQHLSAEESALIFKRGGFQPLRSPLHSPGRPGRPDSQRPCP